MANRAVRERVLPASTTPTNAIAVANERLLIASSRTRRRRCAPQAHLHPVFTNYNSFSHAQPRGAGREGRMIARRSTFIVVSKQPYAGSGRLLRAPSKRAICSDSRFCGGSPADKSRGRARRIHDRRTADHRDALWQAGRRAQRTRRRRCSSCTMRNVRGN